MAGESNQRTSWWKFKSKGSLDSNDEDYENLPPRHTGGVRPLSVLLSAPQGVEVGDANQSLRDLRDRFLQNRDDDLNHNRVFGAELEKSLEVAAAKISVSTDNPDHFFEYGKIPVVVAKCGAYLKHNGLSVEGIFRVGGSSKRVKQLQYIFSSPPDYGKKLDWDGYTVHDAASLLRRFLNSMPEPVIPLDQYEAFRAPLKSRHRILKYLAHRGVPASSTKPLDTAKPVPLATSHSNVQAEGRKPVPPPRPAERPHSAEGLPVDLSDSEEKQKELERKRRRRLKKHKRFVEDINGALQEYEKLVQNLPILRKQLLLYILDLLELFSQHSAENRMSSANLSAVFQPSVLSHPKHDMSPDEYVLSQRVVEFLVEYSYKLLPQQTNKHSESRRSSIRKPTDEKLVRPSIHTNKIKSVSVDNFYVKSQQPSEIPVLPPKPQPLAHPDTPTTLTSDHPDTTDHMEASTPSVNGVVDKIPKRGHSKSLSSANHNSEILLGNTKTEETNAKSLVANDVPITTDDESNSDDETLQKAAHPDTLVFTNGKSDSATDLVDTENSASEMVNSKKLDESPPALQNLSINDKSALQTASSDTPQENTPATPLLTVPDTRASRWDVESSDSKEEKKDKWYKRLKSRSRSNSANRHSAAENGNAEGAGLESKVAVVKN